jgi:hypothetical protein
MRQDGYRRKCAGMNRPETSETQAGRGLERQVTTATPADWTLRGIASSKACRHEAHGTPDQYRQATNLIKMAGTTDCRKRRPLTRLARGNRAIVPSA